MRMRLISVDFGLKIAAFLSTVLALIFSIRKDRNKDDNEMEIHILKDEEQQTDEA
ncbi:hypothetical protein CHS0354_006955, partial [Potamilus streckersoni]